MPAIDLQISSQVRAILARHWIDAERLHFRTTGGTVRFHGVLARKGSFVACDLGMSLMEVLIHEIRRVPGVQKVYFTGVEIEHLDRTSDDDRVHVFDCKFSRKPGAPAAPEITRVPVVCLDPE